MEKLNPNWHLQPRLPAGQTGGGQWTDGDALEESVGEASVLPVSDRPQPPGTYVVPRVDLRQEEAAGGLAIRKHVGRKTDNLLSELRKLKNQAVAVKRMGSFPSLDAANKLINATLNQNRIKVGLVAEGEERVAYIVSEFRSKTGTEAYRVSHRSKIRVRDTYGVGIFLVHDPSRAQGFTIITAFPRSD